MPPMKAVVERGIAIQLRIVGAGNGGEAIQAGVEPLESRSRLLKRIKNGRLVNDD